MAKARRKRSGGRGRTGGPIRRPDLKWSFRYPDGGKRKQVILGADVSEEQAWRIYREKLAASVTRGSGINPNVTVAEIVKKWRAANDADFSEKWRTNLDSLLANHLLTRPRLDAAGRKVRDVSGEAILDPVLRDRIVETLTPADFDVYVSKRKAEGAAPSTINHETGALQAALNWAEIRAKLIRVNPIKGLGRLTENERTVFFTAEEWAAFESAFDDEGKWAAHRAKGRRLGPIVFDPKKGRERRHGGGLKPDGEASIEYLGRLRKAMDVFRGCLLTGSRVGEVTALTWDAVDLKGGYVTIRQTKTRKKVRNADKTITLSDALRALVERQGKGIGKALVFQRPGGGPWEKGKLDRAFAIAQELSGVRAELTIHTLRHTVGSWLTQAGVSSEKVGQMLGHRDPRSTRRYSHLRPEDSAGAAELMGRLSRTS